ncbi:hypothetical protein M5D96_014082 [Drosophila gunungcola]|uniref:Uncharacterized protein n=1 Tax=Drosophila gunungcola TaxID=103775 RepID=A0A9Q0BHR0_9MUSC|nr:hypothetical protein M5D96_014082 [Drosophila gunungcola]
MSAPVRGNKASKLRSDGKVEKLAPIGPSWSLKSWLRTHQSRYQSQSHPDHPQTQCHPDHCVATGETAVNDTSIGQGVFSAELFFTHCLWPGIFHRDGYHLASFSEVLSWTYCLVEWGSNCVATGDSNDTSIGRVCSSRSCSSRIDYGQVYSTAMATTYYACIMVLTIRYLVASFSEVLSWTYCLVEWGSSCVANDTSIGRQNNTISAPVRGNKASKLRSEGKVEKPAPIGPFWAYFNSGSEPTSRDTSPSRIPTIRRPSSIPTSSIPIPRLAGGPTRNTSPVLALIVLIA